MEAIWKTALWQQFGAAIDMLDNALLACPEAVWETRLWDPTDPAWPNVSAEFWYIAYHTLFWLDLNLSGTLEGFAPPEPFTLGELDPAGVYPERPYSQVELHEYLLFGREKCETIIAGLSDETAARAVTFPWTKQKPFSFYELLLYAMRHVQEHAAQLSLTLGRHGIDNATLNWVARAKDKHNDA